MILPSDSQRSLGVAPLTELLRCCAVTLVLLLMSFAATAQHGATVVYGVVTDAVTGEPLPYVALQFVGVSEGGLTNASGDYTIASYGAVDSLKVFCLGYLTQCHAIARGERNELRLRLQPVTVELDEVVVKRGEERYRRKDNPAVELVRKVIERKAQQQLDRLPHYAVEEYEKTVFSIDDYRRAPEDRPSLLSAFKFLNSYVDSSSFTGKPILTFSLKERIIETTHRRDPQAVRHRITAIRHQGVDKEIDQEGIGPFLDECFRDVDLFDDNIPLLYTSFVSPLSGAMATTFYKYFLLDTVVVRGERCTHLACVPFNTNDLGFIGHLYITTDGSYAVRQAVLEAPHNINLNYLDRMQIEQNYDRLADGTWVMTDQRTDLVFRVYSGMSGFYVSKQKCYRDYDFAPPDEHLFDVATIWSESLDAYDTPDSVWVARRPMPLRSKEDALADMVCEFKKIPAFNVFITAVELLAVGYLRVGDEKNAPFEFGPLNTFISANDVEGVRLRVSGGTTAKLHRRLMLKGMVAYGVEDERLKYSGSVIWNVKPRMHHENEFPINAFTLSHTYDMRTPGQVFYFTNKDNMFLSLRSGLVDRMLYYRKTELSYQREQPRGISVLGWANIHREWAAGTTQLNYATSDPLQATPVEYYDMTEFGVSLSYTRNEKFFQGRTNRIPLDKTLPVVTLQHRMAFKGVGWTDYNLQRTDFGFKWRLWTPSFGYFDASVSAGKIWTQVPYTMLAMPNANRSLLLQPEAFMMLSPGLFVCDQYVGWHLNYNMSGWLLNRIPLVKRLRLREVFSFRGYYGTLSDKNNPAVSLDQGLFAFQQGVGSFGKLPYMEASAGMTNIFRLIEVQYVFSLNYRNDPRVFRHGIRFALDFDF